MQDGEFIEGLGGTTAVARRLGVEPNRVNNWKRRGIPAEHHLALWRMAIEADLAWEPPGADGLREVLCPPTDAPSVPEVQEMLEQLHGGKK
jgi:hypothetical protein